MNNKVGEIIHLKKEKMNMLTMVYESADDVWL